MTCRGFVGLLMGLAVAGVQAQPIGALLVNMTDIAASVSVDGELVLDGEKRYDHEENRGGGHAILPWVIKVPVSLGDHIVSGECWGHQGTFSKTVSVPSASQVIVTFTAKDCAHQ